jgi:hypothetical protein
LFVNESTLMPAIAPLAPTRTLLIRLPPAVGDVLAAHYVRPELIDTEVTQMTEEWFWKQRPAGVCAAWWRVQLSRNRIPCRPPHDLLELSVRRALGWLTPIEYENQHRIIQPVA